MTDDSNGSDSLEEVRLLQRLREDQQRAATEPSRAHDAAILEAARTAGWEIQQRSNTRVRTPRWLPLALAAALVLGIGIGRGSWLVQHAREPQLHLTVPAETALRGSGSTRAGTSVPVEQADPAAWYRYIQELLFSGQTELAEQHLRRFRELHPDFVYQP